MQKIAFLDRDGVINNDTGHYYIYKPTDFVLNIDVVDSLKLIQASGYLIVLITNQGGIARGTYNKSDVEKVHQHFIKEVGKAGVVISDIFYCPHHNLIESCLCRKPNGLMIEKAMAKHNADSDECFMIGDNVKDVEAAKSAGIRGYKIDKNTSFLGLLKDIFNGSVV